MREIRHLPEGEFNEKTLQKLITKLSSNFEPYKPDKAILQYLNNHTRQLGLDPPSFANPKDKNNKSDFKSKSRDFKSKSRDSHHDKKDKGKIRFSEQCRNPLCKQRDTHTTHRHKDCRLKDGTQPSPKHPNLGRAPTKSKDN